MEFKTKQMATEKARSLLKLFPKGWKIQVWENMGWHFCFYNKKSGITTRVDWSERHEEFHCSVCNSLAIFNNHIATFSKDPMESLKKALRYAEKRMKEFQDLLEMSKKAFDAE